MDSRGTEIESEGGALHANGVSARLAKLRQCLSPPADSPWSQADAITFSAPRGDGFHQSAKGIDIDSSNVYRSSAGSDGRRQSIISTAASTSVPWADVECQSVASTGVGRGSMGEWCTWQEAASTQQPSEDEEAVAEAGPAMLLTASLRRERDRLRERLNAAGEEVDALQRERDEAVQRLEDVERKLQQSGHLDHAVHQQAQREGHLRERLSALEVELDAATVRGRLSEERLRRQSLAREHGEAVGLRQVEAIESKLRHLEAENAALAERLQASTAEAAHATTLVQHLEEQQACVDAAVDASEQAAGETTAALEARITALQAQNSEARSSGEEAALRAHRQAALTFMRTSQLRCVLADLCASRGLLLCAGCIHAWQRVLLERTAPTRPASAAVEGVGSSRPATFFVPAAGLSAGRRVPTSSSRRPSKVATPAAMALCRRLCSRLQSDTLVRACFALWHRETSLPARPRSLVSLQSPASSEATVPERRTAISKQLTELTQQASGLRSEVARLLASRRSRCSGSAASSQASVASADNGAAPVLRPPPWRSSLASPSATSPLSPSSAKSTREQAMANRTAPSASTAGMTPAPQPGSPRPVPAAMSATVTSNPVPEAKPSGMKAGSELGWLIDEAERCANEVVATDVPAVASSAAVAAMSTQVAAVAVSSSPIEKVDSRASWAEVNASEVAEAGEDESAAAEADDPCGRWWWSKDGLGRGPERCSAGKNEEDVAASSTRTPSTAVQSQSIARDDVGTESSEVPSFKRSSNPYKFRPPPGRWGVNLALDSDDSDGEAAPPSCSRGNGKAKAMTAAAVDSPAAEETKRSSAKAETRGSACLRGFFDFDIDDGLDTDPLSHFGGLHSDRLSAARCSESRGSSEGNAANGVSSGGNRESFKRDILEHLQWCETAAAGKVGSAGVTVSADKVGNDSALRAAPVPATSAVTDALSTAQQINQPRRRNPFAASRPSGR
eukprot:TRINITY_DN27144_c0_g1_i1.p1 TRINITY_DN27144_c0_g1~~TRINITY_DN27144_c0_g1_i1.p1  ORF type:complete len:1002 (-),score=195.08 TRINITY_DN27144_c0_g1_i1:70-2970(-)